VHAGVPQHTFLLASSLELDIRHASIADTMDKIQEASSTYHPRFSFPEGDIALCSKDGTLFRVPSMTLRMASGFFRSTLTLPQKPTSSEEKDSSETSEPEVLSVEEPARVIETLLNIVCCLGLDPATALASFDDISGLLFAAEKYEIPGVTAFLRTAIMGPRFLEDPLRVYALSCRYGWDAEAELTSRLTLSLDLSEQKHRSTLDTLHGAHLMSLLHLRWLRKSQLRTALDKFAASRVPYKCQRCYAVIDVHAWRELKWLMLDEIERRPSGESIKTQAFSDSPTARSVFSLTCPQAQCGRLCFDKDATLENIGKAIDALPSSV